MGSASCKNPKSTQQNQKEEDNKKITIGVFGLDNAGKTSTVKAIEGAPTKNVNPTIGSQNTKVPYPVTNKGDNKKSQERITIIDVSGEKNFRQRSWSNFYNQIHGLIFVIDASEKKRMKENRNTLDDLLNNDDLKNKPILILANKQDRQNAIDSEEDIRERLQIEELERKHKIKFCAAIPGAGNKPDDSIRQGFSWLIRNIENNYAEINSRVINTKTTRSPRPTERKPQTNNKHRMAKSDQSDSDNDGVVYTTNNRTISSPPLNKKPPDYRSLIDSVKLPNLDLSKTKIKRSGHQTYSESDNDDDINSRLRPNISRQDNDRNLSINPSTTNNFNKKRKVIGSTSNNNNNTNELSTKRSYDNDLKPFRSSYEPFPEQPPWSSSSIKKPTKSDDIPFRLNTKSSLTNETIKRPSTPLVHDTKQPYNSSSSILKRDNDDDDFLNRTQKPKSTFPSLNKPTSTVKKPLSSLYGIDDVEENNYSRKTTKGFGSDDDESKNKNNINKQVYPRLSDRFNSNNDNRGLSLKPPSSPSISTSRSKIDDDGGLPSSLTSKGLNRSKFNKDDYSSTFSKPIISSKFNNSDDDDDRHSSSLKTPVKPKHNFDDDDRPLSISKINAHSKYGDNDNKSTSKLTSRSKYDDDDDLPSSTSKYGTRSRNDNNYSSTTKPTTYSKYNDDDDYPSSLSKPVTRSKYGDTNRSLSPIRSNLRSKQDDDDFPSSSTKPIGRSRYDDDDDRSTSLLKSGARSKFGTDDNTSSSKLGTRSNYKDIDRPSSPVRAASRWKSGDDNDSPTKPSSYSKFEDDDDYKSSSKPVTRSSYKSTDRSSPTPPSKQNSRWKYDDDDDDRSSSPVKPTSRSKFEDDDDYVSSSKPATRSNYKSTDRSSPTPPSKQNSRWKHGDDDDDDRSSSPVKPTSHSKFEDDDDYPAPSSSRKTNYSSRDNDHNGGTRTRFGLDDYDSSKNRFNSDRIGSASANRFRSNS